MNTLSLCLFLLIHFLITVAVYVRSVGVFFLNVDEVSLLA